MKIMASIKQNLPEIPASLPDFSNLGVSLRILVLANLFGLAAAMVRAPGLSGLLEEMLSVATLLEPVLLSSLLVLYGTDSILKKLPHTMGVGAVLILEMLVTSGVWLFNVSLLGGENLASLAHWNLIVLIASVTILAYLSLHSRALSPALVEARLQALQARIRPHFLFNSINAVLSLIREDPQRAETALEDMADLFRVLMADNRKLIPLESELALCRQYLDLEKLRLGSRLRVVWNTDHAPMDALIPPLVLQPLVENAVYHGIEPVETGGEIILDISREGDQVLISLTNPYPENGTHHEGNHMAIENIKERLALHFDFEASLDSMIDNGQYQVTIRLPYHP